MKTGAGIDGLNNFSIDGEARAMSPCFFTLNAMHTVPTNDPGLVSKMFEAHTLGTASKPRRCGLEVLLCVLSASRQHAKKVARRAVPKRWGLQFRFRGGSLGAFCALPAFLGGFRAVLGSCRSVFGPVLKILGASCGGLGALGVDRVRWVGGANQW